MCFQHDMVGIKEVENKNLNYLDVVGNKIG